MSWDIMTLAVLLFAVLCPLVTAETVYWIEAVYSNEECNDTPHLVVASDADGVCEEGQEFECFADSGLSNKATCSTSYLPTMRDMFGSSPYIIQEIFDDSSCSSLSSDYPFIAYGYFASEICEGDDTSSYIATIDTSGLSSIEYYNDSSCSESLGAETASSSTLLDHSCDEDNYYKWYSSYDDISGIVQSSPPSSSNSEDSGSNTHAPAETMYRIDAYFSASDCDGIPYRAVAYKDSTCTQQDFNISCASFEGEFTNGKCSKEYLPEMQKMFEGDLYIIQETFTDSTCTTFFNAFGYLASGRCEGPGDSATNPFYHIAILNRYGTSSIDYYKDSQCSTPDVKQDSESAPSTTLQDHSCDTKRYKWYSSYDPPDGERDSDSGPGTEPPEPPDGGSGSSTGAIIGIICGLIVVVLVLVGFLIIYRRRSHDKPRSPFPTEPDEPGTITGQPHLWNDNVIISKRIPRDKVKVKKRLNNGAYGEVYRGVYNRREVAIKMLLPATRGNLKYVNDFLAEAKLTATMDHPHIITFIGVAWDSLSDVCIVLEFMDGGDLRTLLNSYEATKRPVGFNKQKATIALHVCEALTYLHSLMPPVIHRDLKSRNILLSRNLEAKLTDFGISKERLDQMMTMGVGTSLWMAPEVMISDNYDIKADMFSFGVVLSELDVHTLPYTQAKERSLASTGRKMADATLLQKVAEGEIRVEFSESIPRPLLELGLACVSVNPADRPTAAEALYRLQASLSKELA